MRAYLARLIGHALKAAWSSTSCGSIYGDGRQRQGHVHRRGASRALGDYADAADPELLNARTFDAHPTGTADLFGLRLAVLHETDKGGGSPRAPSSGSPAATGSRPGGCGRTSGHFDPSHTFVMLTNHKPVVSGTDEGDLARGCGSSPGRWSIPAAERDERWATDCALELDAVLALARRRLPGLARARPRRPRRGHRSDRGYRAESDALGRFIDQQCMTGPHFHVRSSELYTAWCEVVRRGRRGTGHSDGVLHRADRTAASTRRADQRSGRSGLASASP